jgi:hypothetical protein
VGHGSDEEHEIQIGFISLFGAPGCAGGHGGHVVIMATNGNRVLHGW